MSPETGSTGLPARCFSPEFAVNTAHPRKSFQHLLCAGLHQILVSADTLIRNFL
jgi:hypothetical protein